MTNNYNEQSGSIPIESIRWDSSWPGLAKAADRNRLFGELENRFGIPEVLFEEYLLFRKKKSWWLLKASKFISTAAQYKVSIPGLRAFQRINRFVKPTTRFIQIFGREATKAILNIERETFENLETGEPFPVDLTLDNGYIILLFEGHPLGLGLLIDGLVHPQIPRKELRFFR